MGTLFAIIGLVLGGYTGYTATKKKKSGSWTALGVGVGVVGGAFVGSVVDQATGI
jgi:hypothetical protein